MPQPISICIENCYPAHESLRFLRCVAISGARKGLALLPGGEVDWLSDAPCQGRIWVSADERLIFFRPAGSLDWAQVHRGGRSVDVPDGKPVVLIDGDYLVVPGFCFRVHLHGKTAEIHEPTYLDQGEPARKTHARLAAAGLMALSTIFGANAACTTEKPVQEKPDPATQKDPVQSLPPMTEPDPGKTDPPVDIRDHPPEPMPDDAYRSIRPGNHELASVPPPSSTVKPPVATQPTITPPVPPIEVRDAPPSDVPDPPPPEPMKPPKRPPMKGDMTGDMDAGVNETD